MLKHLDLFAGCGGFTRACEQTGRIATKQFVENDDDAVIVLTDRWPPIPVHRDIRDYHCHPGQFDLITAGFPCTGTSVAGTRTGLGHSESALFREALRVICQCRPRFAVIEQPLGVIHRGLRAILGGLRMAGYRSELEIVSAAELGAGHLRERLFIVSYPDCQSRNVPTGWHEQIGDLVTATRADCQWLTVVGDRLRPDSGLSPGLVFSVGGRDGTDYALTCPTRTPGRIRARKLAGRTVTPGQALIAIERVLYLNEMLYL